MPLGVLLLAITVVVACEHRSATRENAEAPRANRSIDSVRTAANTPPSTAPIDTADDCGLVRAQRFPDPLELARYYVELDSAGVFLGSNPVSDSVYLCPIHLPGPDAFLVVKDTRLRLLARADTTAEVEFAGVKAGIMSADSTGQMYLRREPSAIVDTFHLVKTAYGWRIDSPQLPDWVSGRFVMQQANEWHLKSETVDSIKAFLARPGA